MQESRESFKFIIDKLVDFTLQIKKQVVTCYKDNVKFGFLHTLVKNIRTYLIQDINIESFADMFAQTITYGLFTAKVIHKSAFNITNLDLISNFSNPFLKSFFYQISNNDDFLVIEELGVVELLDFLSKVDVESILIDFQKENENEDPIIHFYEYFLQKFNPKLREMRGVYYTPDPIAKFIIKSIDSLLEKELLFKGGLLNENIDPVTKLPIIQVLDPASGTGTFLFHIINQMKVNWNQTNNSLSETEKFLHWQKFVKEQLLTRFTGIELLLAPYAIAHLAIQLKLLECNYVPDTNDTIRIFLSNTLQRPPVSLQDLSMHSNVDWLSQEIQDTVQFLTYTNVNVIIGNPPYSGHSANKDQWITNLMKGKNSDGTRNINYFQVDGNKLEEKNPKFLNDDYVKFFRFAQWRIEKTGYGILAFVTNHGYLDNPTFRGMRSELMKTFNNIYILDLHGNIKKKETSPDGSKDENVFEIQQGVSIGIFVKIKGLNNCQVYHYELFGSRQDKYAFLNKESVNTINWRKIEPFSPWYMFYPLQTNMFNEYNAGYNLADIFSSFSVGIMTGNDDVTIQDNPKTIATIIFDLLKLPEDEFKTKYALKKDRRQWTYKKAKNDVLAQDFSSHDSKDEIMTKIHSKVIKILYRPFDFRYTFFTGNSTGFHERPRTISKSMILGTNVGLVISRNSKPDPWRDIQITEHAIELGVMATKPGNNAPLFPLYLYSQENTIIKKQTNIKIEFINTIKRNYPSIVKNIYEMAFYYIFALLNSNSYRSRYDSFLKIDFPRILLPKNQELFEKLSKIGKELADIQLFKIKIVPTLNVIFVKGHEEKIIVRRILIDGDKIFVNKNQCFTNIPLEVSNFYIGGYKVLEKWFKEKLGKELSTQEVKFFISIVNVIYETIKIMKDIDIIINEYGSFPGAFLIN